MLAKQSVTPREFCVERDKVQFGIGTYFKNIFSVY